MSQTSGSIAAASLEWQLLRYTPLQPRTSAYAASWLLDVLRIRTGMSQQAFVCACSSALALSTSTTTKTLANVNALTTQFAQTKVDMTCTGAPQTVLASACPTLNYARRQHSPTQCGTTSPANASASKKATNGVRRTETHYRFQSRCISTRTLAPALSLKSAAPQITSGTKKSASVHA